MTCDSQASKSVLRFPTLDLFYTHSNERTPERYWRSASHDVGIVPEKNLRGTNQFLEIVEGLPSMRYQMVRSLWRSGQQTCLLSHIVLQSSADEENKHEERKWPVYDALKLLAYSALPVRNMFWKPSTSFLPVLHQVQTRCTGWNGGYTWWSELWSGRVELGCPLNVQGCKVVNEHYRLHTAL